MKVLLVSHTYALRINHAKLQRVSQLGVDLHVLVPSNWRSGDDLFSESLFELQDSEGPDFRLSARPVWRPGHRASHLFSIHTALRLIREIKPDLIHIENEAYSFLAAQFTAAARLLGIKTTLFVWENVEWRLHPSQYLCRTIALRFANGVVCGSAGAMKLIKKWGYSGPVMISAQLGVDPCVFLPPSSFKRNSVPTVGFAGRLVPEKGCDLILRAISALVHRGIAVRCVLCGNGPARASLAQLAKELHITGVVTFLQDVPPEGVPAVLSEVDIFVLPSRTAPRWAEQFGHVLIEAMCCGCMVVGSDSGAIPEVVGRADMIFRENDAGDLARVLSWLVENPQTHQGIREFFQRRVAEKYTHEVIASRLACFWQRVTAIPMTQAAPLWLPSGEAE